MSNKQIIIYQAQDGGPEHLRAEISNGEVLLISRELRITQVQSIPYDRFLCSVPADKIRELAQEFQI